MLRKITGHTTKQEQVALIASHRNCTGCPFLKGTELDKKDNNRLILIFCEIPDVGSAHTYEPRTPGSMRQFNNFAECKFYKNNAQDIELLSEQAHDADGNQQMVLAS